MRSEQLNKPETEEQYTKRRIHCITAPLIEKFQNRLRLYLKSRLRELTALFHSQRTDRLNGDTNLSCFDSIQWIFFVPNSSF